KSAAGGQCATALTLTQKIAKMNPEFYKRRVAGDPTISSCSAPRKSKAAQPAAKQQRETDQTEDSKPAQGPVGRGAPSFRAMPSRLPLLLLALVACQVRPPRAEGPVPASWAYPLDGKAVTAPHAIVVSDSALATHVGAAVLAQGGNAVDAAVATAFALAVTLP